MSKNINIHGATQALPNEDAGCRRVTKASRSCSAVGRPSTRRRKEAVLGKRRHSLSEQDLSRDVFISHAYYSSLPVADWSSAGRTCFVNPCRVCECECECECVCVCVCVCE